MSYSSLTANLTPEQTHSLNQLRDLTNGGDDEVTVGVLESVGWDVERAAEMIFGAGAGAGGGMASSSRASTHRRFEEFEVDDSEQGSRSGLSFSRNSPPTPPTPLLSLGLTILTYPLHILTSLLRFVLGLLRIRLPRLGLPPFLSLNWYLQRTPRTAGRSRGTGRGGPERWVRELEEETGAVCLSRIGVSGEATGVQATGGTAFTSNEPGPSNLTSRTTYTTPHDDSSIDDPLLHAHISSPDGTSQKFLPDFTLTSYDAFLRLCQSSLSIGCVILVSEEHDDVAQFKRDTLTDHNFVSVLRRNGILVWGGDVRDREAYGAMNKLGATTFPFVGFVGLQPSRNISSGGRNGESNGGGGGSGGSVLNVLSRHQGFTQTTPSTLITHLETTLLPRVGPYLSRLRSSRRALEQERKLREAQDRAFEESARLDRERILEKIRLEKEVEERKAREEKEKIEKEEREARERAERVEWRRWFRRWVEEDGKNKNADTGKTIRIAVRMPSGQRLVKNFHPTDSLTLLYALVDTQFISPDMNPVDDPSHPPSGLGSVGIDNTITTVTSQHPSWWGFTLASAYPRRAIPWAANTSIGEVSALRDGAGQVVVEMTSVSSTGANGRNSIDKGKGKASDIDGGVDDGDDGYVTESSDEE